MDAEINASLKKKNRKLQYERAFDIIEEINSNIYNIDHSVAMKYIRGVWKNGEMGKLF